MHASIVLVLALAAAASAQFGAPAQPQQFVVRPPVPILKHEEIRDDHGQFSLSYQTGDGQAFSEHGELKPTQEGYVLVKSGSYGYTAPDGTPIMLTYTADENGYQPTGSHLPVAPAVPIA